MANLKDITPVKHMLDSCPQCLTNEWVTTKIQKLSGSYDVEVCSGCGFEARMVMYESGVENRVAYRESPEFGSDWV